MKMARILVIMLGVLATQVAQAQCAMCRTQLENNVSNGDPGIAASINGGILYLLVMPYLAVAVIGYFWYKSSKKAKANDISKRIVTR